ncbi:serine hydrolase domain-containing protein [Streptomyces sp. NPDC049910]|uniref:serine hydrolase domain-containing protein n=1 Tax=Streptomyces sp. NPDC049910 TaxID=3155278 RepID=UPI0034246B39
MTADRRRTPGLSLLLHRPGEEPATLHTGLSSLEHGVAIGPETAFNTGSVAKQITAHLVLLAAKDGLLHLTQKAADLLPRLRISDITVGDLTTHRSGLRDAESLLSLAGFRDLDHYTANDLRNLAYRQDRRAVPNERFLYSNTNYLLLAEILEIVHGTTLAGVAQRALFGPLGMNATSFKTDPHEVIPGGAAAYRAAAIGWEHSAAPVTLPGPGSLWTTASDLSRWLEYLHDRWQPEQLPGQKDVRYHPSDYQPYLYGPGLYADARPGRASVFHYGHEQGFSAATHLSSTGLRVVCLSNHAGIAADYVVAALLRELRTRPAQDLADLLSRAAATQPRSQRVTPASPAPAATEQHTELGTFTCGQVPGHLRITHIGDALYLWRRGTADQLTKSGPQSYSGDGYRLTLTGDAERPDAFVLSLDRAPGLVYARR